MKSMKGLKSMLLSTLAVIAAMYLGLGLILYYMQPSFLYAPMREVLYTPADLGLTFEKLQLKTTDELTISAWYIPADDAEFTILFCHGNGGNMAHRLDSIDIFNKLGLNCLIFDYRGYGTSQGSPTEQGTYDDAEAAYKWLTESNHIPPQNIIIFGRSLGASVAAQLAINVDASAGVILESSFTSYLAMGRKFYPYMPVKWFARFSYNTIDNVRLLNCPALIIHSRNDDVVPFEFGLQLYEAANEPKEFVEIFSNHNDGFLNSGEVYTNGLKDWLGLIKESHRQSFPKLKRIS